MVDIHTHNIYVFVLLFRSLDDDDKAQTSRSFGAENGAPRK